MRFPTISLTRQAVVRGLLISAALATVAGCSKAPEPAGDAPVRIAVPVIPPAIGNPYQGISIPAVLALQAIFDTVTTLDANGEPQPALALSWEQESPTSWLFKLRTDVKFSNGEPLTADALVVSVDHMTSKEGRGETIGSTLFQIEGAEKVDDLTVRIKLNQPDPILPIHASVWRIPAPAQWKTLKLPEAARDAIGSGPYVIATRADGKLELKPNPTSWRKPNAGGLTLMMIPDSTARLQAFTSGAVDMALALALDAKPSVEATGGKLISRMTPAVDYIGFNTEGRKTPLNDPRVRVALNMAVNRDLLTKSVLKDTTTPASQIGMPGSYGYNAALKPIPYDPAGAKKLLAAAGYPNGFKVKMSVTTGEGGGDALVYQQVGNDLKKVGVEAEIMGRPSTRQMQDLFTGSMDADLFAWVTRGNDPLNDYRIRSCLKPSAARKPFHCDPKLTEIARTALAENDPDKRKALYGQVAAYEQTSPTGIVLWQVPAFDAVSPKVGGYAPVQDVMQLDLIKRTAN
ncbi:ABC transporter substrate-binding protein [Sphingomonas crocodyli]|uniref:ABC transporter substrate-binding protein n=1 Tax=Sphingomonas crocodyli TaxID=1979270 RepID=A0A437LZW7_9SPHN|nr:ABC transporter substrate-binding protein [Sphingomonas crocodyli]RVT90979.1 ABC transporter substrate-binding protein [Sphingomonas crocodyli]